MIDVGRRGKSGRTWAPSAQKEFGLHEDFRFDYRVCRKIITAEADMKEDVMLPRSDRGSHKISAIFCGKKYPVTKV